MPIWAVICIKCNSKILHSQATNKSLEDFYIPWKPEVPVDSTITCPNCGTVVSYVRTDLRYLANG